ncbi:A24 family peptidase [Tersicoccus sp. MR15.9]|uniref:prepilin peptidase n=1 Tax=Tersicoccus mangrovi TaxID=3121635 RepID=UPI002FE67B70
MSTTTAPTAADVDGTELSPDVDEPWAHRLTDPVIAGPVAGIALIVALTAGWANAAAGPVGALLAAALGAILVVLTAIDLLVMRLPDVIVLPAYPIAAAAAVTMGALGERSWSQVGGAFAAMVIAYVIAWLLAAFTGGFGWGDVKLVGLLALVFGLHGPGQTVLGVFIVPVLLGSLVALPMMIAGKRDAAIPFGPFLAAGALVVVYVGDPLVAFLLNPA